MSTTGNEYEKPGVNYPDREDADGARETPAQGDPVRREPTAPSSSAPAGEPSHEAVGIGVIDDGRAPTGGAGSAEELAAQGGAEGDAAAPDESGAAELDPEQRRRLPAMAEQSAEQIERISGVVAQTRADAGTDSSDRIVEVLRERLRAVGVALPETDLRELASQVSTGDADEPATG